MKRSRAPNFTTAEVMLLVKLVEKYPVIENKRTDGGTTKEKQMAWQSLADEYNSQTNFSPRTANNLLSCYKNQKNKAKKMHSNEKTAVRAPLLLNAIKELEKDWDLVAQATNARSSDCQNTFEQLVMEARKEEALHKNEINCTGKKKLNVSHSFQELAYDEEHLVKRQKILTDYQMQHQQILIQLANEKLQFEKRKNEMELGFLQQKYKLELDLLRNKNK